MAPANPVLLGRLTSCATRLAPTTTGDDLYKPSEAASCHSCDMYNNVNLDPGIPINPEDFVPDDQQIVLRGYIWKLSCSGDPRILADYTRVLAWLTSGAGIFYYSQEDDQPLGRNIRGYCAKTLDTAAAEPPYSFELVSPQQATGSTRSTVFATDTHEQRSAWIDHISRLQRPSNSSIDLTPLDLFRACSVPNSCCNSNASSRCNSDESRRARSRSGSNSRTPQSSPRVRSSSICSQSPSVSGFSDSLDADHSSDSSRYGKFPVMLGINDELDLSALEQKASTVLVLDWDDTIFPTTWIRQDCDMDWRRPLEQQVKMYGERSAIITRLMSCWVQRVSSFLEEAMARTTVFIVTLAQRGWVEKSVNNFAPDLRTLLDLNSLKIIYAQDYAKEVEQEVMRQDEFRSCEQEIHFWTQVKARAILKELENFHSKESAHLTSIISFGDAEFERGGTIDAAQKYANGNVNLQTKTLKLVDEPTIEELNAQLTLLMMWLPHLVARRGNIDVEIKTTDDDEELMRLNNIITGRSNELSWVSLAGM